MPLNFHELTEEDYLSIRFEIILNVEQGGRLSLKPYLDSMNLPTIGLGMKLEDEVSGKAVIDRILNENKSILLSAEGQLQEIHYKRQIEAIIKDTSLISSHNNETLQYKLDSIMMERAHNPIITYPNKRLTFAFTNDNEIKETFNSIAEKYELRITNKLKNIPLSMERAVLFSLAYNNHNLIGPNLIKAIENGNRAEAFCQIRYYSNGGKSKSDGIAKIRYYESQLFGLFDNVTDISTEEIQQISDMLDKHKQHIDEYDNKYSAQICAANRDYRTSCVQALNDSLEISHNNAALRISPSHSAKLSVHSQITLEDENKAKKNKIIATSKTLDVHSPDSYTLIQANIDYLIKKLSENNTDQWLTLSNNPITQDWVNQNRKFLSWQNKMYFFRTSEAAYYPQAEVAPLIHKKTGLDVTVIDETPSGQFHIKAIYSKDLNDITLAIRGTVPSNIDNLQDDIRLFLGSLTSYIFKTNALTFIDDPTTLKIVQFAETYYKNFITVTLPKLRDTGVVSANCTITFSGHSLGTIASTYLSKEYGGKCFNLESPGMSPVHFKNILGSANFQHHNFNTYQSTPNYINQLNPQGNPGDVYRKRKKTQNTYTEAIIYLLDKHPVCNIVHSLCTLNDEHSAGNTLNRTDEGDFVIHEQYCPVNSLPGYPFGPEPTIPQNINLLIIKGYSEKTKGYLKAPVDSQIIISEDTINTSASFHEIGKEVSTEINNSKVINTTENQIETKLLPTYPNEISSNDQPEFDRSLTFYTQFISTYDENIGISERINIPLSPQTEFDIISSLSSRLINNPQRNLDTSLTSQINILDPSFQKTYVTSTQIGVECNHYPNSQIVNNINGSAFFTITDAGAVSFSIAGTIAAFDNALVIGYNTTQGLYISFTALSSVGIACGVATFIVVAAGYTTLRLLEKRNANLFSFLDNNVKENRALGKLVHQLIREEGLSRNKQKRFIRAMNTPNQSPADTYARTIIKYHLDNPTPESIAAFKNNEDSTLIDLYIKAYSDGITRLNNYMKNNDILSAYNTNKELLNIFPNEQDLIHNIELLAKSKGFFDNQKILDSALQQLTSIGHTQAYANFNAHINNEFFPDFYRLSFALALKQKAASINSTGDVNVDTINDAERKSYLAQAQKIAHEIDNKLTSQSTLKPLLEQERQLQDDAIFLATSIEIQDRDTNKNPEFLLHELNRIHLPEKQPAFTEAWSRIYDLKDKALINEIRELHETDTYSKTEKTVKLQALEEQRTKNQIEQLAHIFDQYEKNLKIDYFFFKSLELAAILKDDNALKIIIDNELKVIQSDHNTDYSPAQMARFSAARYASFLRGMNGDNLETSATEIIDLLYVGNLSNKEQAIYYFYHAQLARKQGLKDKERMNLEFAYQSDSDNPLIAIDYFIMNARDQDDLTYGLTVLSKCFKVYANCLIQYSDLNENAKWYTGLIQRMGDVIISGAELYVQSQRQYFTIKINDTALKLKFTDNNGHIDHEKLEAYQNAHHTELSNHLQTLQISLASLRTVVHAFPLEYYFNKDNIKTIEIYLDNVIIGVDTTIACINLNNTINELPQISEAFRNLDLIKLTDLKFDDVCNLLSSCTPVIQLAVTFLFGNYYPNRRQNGDAPLDCLNIAAENTIQLMNACAAISNKITYHLENNDVFKYLHEEFKKRDCVILLPTLHITTKVAPSLLVGAIVKILINEGSKTATAKLIVSYWSSAGLAGQIIFCGGAVLIIGVAAYEYNNYCWYKNSINNAQIKIDRAILNPKDVSSQKEAEVLIDNVLKTYPTDETALRLKKIISEQTNMIFRSTWIQLLNTIVQFSLKSLYNHQQLSQPQHSMPRLPDWTYTLTSRKKDSQSKTEPSIAYSTGFFHQKTTSPSQARPNKHHVLSGVSIQKIVNKHHVQVETATLKIINKHHVQPDLLKAKRINTHTTLTKPSAFF